MILYHITKRKHVMSILRYGLKPAHRRGINVSHKKCQHVFLTNDIDYIVNDQCGREWAVKHDCVVLHVDTRDLPIRPHRHYSGATYTESNVEFVVERVQAEKIIGVFDL